MRDGKTQVVAIVTASGYQESEVLRRAASVERASEHPLADAIVRAAKERNLDVSTVEAFDSPTGRGATGKVDGKTVLLGNSNFLKSAGIDTGPFDEQAERLREHAATVINIALDGTLAAVFATP